MQDEPQAQPHNGSGAEPAAEGAAMVHAKVVLVLVQPYGEVDIAAQVVVVVRALVGVVLLLSHFMALPWSPGMATSVAILQASLGPVMVGGAGVGYRVTVVLLDLTAGHWALAFASAWYTPAAKVPLKVAALPVPVNVAPESGALSRYNRYTTPLWVADKASRTAVAPSQ